MGEKCGRFRKCFYVLQATRARSDNKLTACGLKIKICGLFLYGQICKTTFFNEFIKLEFFNGNNQPASTQTACEKGCKK